MTKLKEAINQRKSKLAIDIIRGNSPSALLEYAQYRYKQWCQQPNIVARFRDRWAFLPMTRTLLDYFTYQVCGAERGNGWNCLRLAIVNGMQDVVEEILNKDFHNRIWEFISRAPNIGWGIAVPYSDLDVAVCCRNLGMVKFLMGRMFIDESIGEERYPIHFRYLSPVQLAVLPNFDLAIVQYLLENGFSVHDTSDTRYHRSDDSIPISDATRLQLRPSPKGTIYDIKTNSSEEQLKLVNLYISEGEADGTLVDIRDGVKNGTVLFYAIRYNPDNNKTVELIKLLLEHGADANKITEFRGKEVNERLQYNALQYAEYLGKHEIAIAILAHQNQKLSTIKETPHKQLGYAKRPMFI